MGHDDRFASRFDGAEAWDELSAEQQRVIGAIALELALAWRATDTYPEIPEVGASQHAARPFLIADRDLYHALKDTVAEALPDVMEAEPLPVPMMVGPVCRVCGCSQQDACPEGCDWSEHDLCTACTAEKEAAA